MLPTITKDRNKTQAINRTYRPKYYQHRAGAGRVLVVPARLAAPQHIHNLACTFKHFEQVTVTPDSHQAVTMTLNYLSMTIIVIMLISATAIVPAVVHIDFFSTVSMLFMVMLFVMAVRPAMFRRTCQSAGCR